MTNFIVALLISAFCFSEIQAQDTLYKKNGDILITRILEINPVSVKYKKFQFLDGPVYILDKTELFMIRYENGMKDIFLNEPTKKEEDYAKDTKIKKNSLDDVIDNPIKADRNSYSIGYFSLYPKKVDQILLSKNDTQISLMINTAQTNKKTSKLLTFAPIPCGVGAYITLIAGSIAASNPTYTTNNASIPYNYMALTGILTAAGFGTAIAAIVLNAKSKKLRHEAVELYNLKYYGTK